MKNQEIWLVIGIIAVIIIGIFGQKQPILFELTGQECKIEPVVSIPGDYLTTDITSGIKSVYSAGQFTWKFVWNSQIIASGQSSSTPSSSAVKDGYEYTYGTLILWHAASSTQINKICRQASSELSAKGEFVSSDIPSTAKTGDSIRLFVYVKNSGAYSGTIFSNIYEDDTGTALAYGGASLDPGQSGWANTITTSMPSKIWKLRIEIGHYEINNPVIDQTVLKTVCNSNYQNPADTNCDGKVSRTELGAYAMKWINGQVTRQALGQAAMAWIGTG